MANRYIPFGYEIVDAQVVIIEREAEVVRNVFSLYVQGNSLKTISERLIYAETFENICIYNERESHEKRQYRNCTVFFCASPSERILLCICDKYFSVCPTKILQKIF